jgi:hypothetical protein
MTAISPVLKKNGIKIRRHAPKKGYGDDKTIVLFQKYIFRKGLFGTHFPPLLIFFTNTRYVHVKTIDFDVHFQHKIKNDEFSTSKFEDIVADYVTLHIKPYL